MTTGQTGDRTNPLGPSAAKRVEVIWVSVRGLHQGQQLEAAQTGRTHGCTRPIVRTNSPLHREGRPHMVPSTAKPCHQPGWEGRPPHHLRMAPAASMAGLTPAPL